MYVHSSPTDPTRSVFGCTGKEASSQTKDRLVVRPRAAESEDLAQSMALPEILALLDQSGGTPQRYLTSVSYRNQTVGEEYGWIEVISIYRIRLKQPGGTPLRHLTPQCLTGTRLSV